MKKTKEFSEGGIHRINRIEHFKFVCEKDGKMHESYIEGGEPFFHAYCIVKKKFSTEKFTAVILTDGDNYKVHRGKECDLDIESKTLLDKYIKKHAHTLVE